MLEAERTAGDVVASKEPGEEFCLPGGPSGPRPAFQGAEYAKEMPGGKVWGIFADGEHITDVGQELQRVARRSVIEERIESDGGFFGPVTADEVSEAKQRFGAILLASGKVGDAGRRFAHFLQTIPRFIAPFVEPADEGSGGKFRVSIGDAADVIGRPLALEQDGDAATGERAGKVTVAGEGLGTEEIEFGGAASAKAAENAGTGRGAAQHGHERLTFA